MKKLAWAGAVAALLVGAPGSTADDTAPTYEMPKPQQEHEWLRQLVGDWDTETEIFAEPGQPPMKLTGSEQSRMIGGFWAVFEHHGELMGAPFTGILTVGYDPEKKAYIGTWIDSVSSQLWHYVGSVDAAGKVLTLEAEGPCHEEPGKTLRFRESIEVKSADHKVFTSMVERDGKWVLMMTIHYHRKK